MKQHYYKSIPYVEVDEDYILCEKTDNQLTIFDVLEKKYLEVNISSSKLNQYIYMDEENRFNINNRRYIGSKQKLIDWIFSIIQSECHGDSFTDIFSGTGIVGSTALSIFKKVIFNDFLHSNYFIYKAFLGEGEYNDQKIIDIINDYNNLKINDIKDNYFSQNFGDKYFNNNNAKLIGYIREDIEEKKSELSSKEYYILIASLIYSLDKVANTVGHYDAYIKKAISSKRILLKPIRPILTDSKTVELYREDANILSSSLYSDIIYIDPPYNSRQYSRFYHLLENLTEWKKPNLFGTALKPKPQNMSDYCRVKASVKFTELIKNLHTKYIVVSYNNTYNSKSNSSKNKITLDEILLILQSRGNTKIFSREYSFFNTGKTEFSNHKEYLFVTKVTNEPV